MDKSALLAEQIRLFFAAVEQEHYEQAAAHLEQINLVIHSIDFSKVSKSEQLQELLTGLNSDLSSSSSRLVVMLSDIVDQLRPKNSSTDLSDGVVYRKHHGKF